MVQPDTREVGIGISELMALIGLPARLVGRLPLSPRYLWGGFHILNPGTSAYAEARWGKWYRLRVWLLPDIKELELLEELINRGSNRKIAAFRQSQLSLCGIIAITVGLLLRAMRVEGAKDYAKLRLSVPPGCPYSTDDNHCTSTPTSGPSPLHRARFLHREPGHALSWNILCMRTAACTGSCDRARRATDMDQHGLRMP